MNIILKLTSLPELQRFDREHRRSAVLDWWIALWKSWPIFLADFGLWCLALGGIELSTDILTDNSASRFLIRGALFVPAFYLVSIVRNYTIFMPRWDVLKRILEARV